MINNIINVYYIYSLILLFVYLLLMIEYFMGFNLCNMVNKMFNLIYLLLEYVLNYYIGYYILSRTYLLDCAMYIFGRLL